MIIIEMIIHLIVVGITCQYIEYAIDDSESGRNS